MLTKEKEMTINLFAGMGGHQSARSQTDEWLTPPEIIAALGSFDLDPCAPVNRPWPTAAHHFTIEDDGLTKPWEGRVWMNPPYGDQTGRWLARLASHGVGTALIFARTETEMFFRWVWRGATALLFIEGRLNFHFVDGRRSKKNSGAPSVLCAYGVQDAERLADSGIDGQFVPLLLPTFVAVVGTEARMSWRELVREVVGRQGSPIRLDELYALLRRHPKSRTNRNYEAKVCEYQARGLGCYQHPAPAHYRTVCGYP